VERPRTPPRRSWWASQESRAPGGASPLPEDPVQAATPPNGGDDEVQRPDNRAARLAALITQMASTINAMAAGSKIAVEFADESDFSIRIQWAETFSEPASTRRPRKRRSREVA